MQWTITITPSKWGGFNYVTNGKGLGHAGYVGTRKALADILSATIKEYLPEALPFEHVKPAPNADAYLLA